MLHLPPEVCHCVLGYIHSVNDLKHMSLVSKSYYGFVYEKLWAISRIKQVLSLNQLKQLIHLPIKTLVVNGSKGKVSSSKKWTDVLVKFKGLKSLTLRPIVSAVLQPEGLIALSQLDIEELSISYCVGINNAYMQAIAQITSLKRLRITGNKKITDEGICYLDKLIHLNYLDISGCKGITSKGFHALSLLPIEELRADDAYIDEDCLEAITK